MTKNRFLQFTLWIYVFILSFPCKSQELNLRGEIENIDFKGNIDSAYIKIHYARLNDSIIERVDPYEMMFVLYYNLEGKITNKQYFQNDSTKNTLYRYFYDLNYRIIKEETVEPSGQVKFTTEFAYDNNGRIIKEKRLSSTGKTNNWIIKNDYDKNIAIRQEKYGDLSVDEYESIYHFDSEGRIIMIDNGSKIQICEYDSIGNKLITIETNKSNLHYIVNDKNYNYAKKIEKMTYDSHSNMTSLTRIEYNQEKFKKEIYYEYDKLGNWIVKIDSWGGRPRYYTERNIFYK